jgi:uncharacterized membrane protein
LLYFNTGEVNPPKAQHRAIIVIKLIEPYVTKICFSYLCHSLAQSIALALPPSLSHLSLIDLVKSDILSKVRSKPKLSEHTFSTSNIFKLCFEFILHYVVMRSNYRSNISMSTSIPFINIYLERE